MFSPFIFVLCLVLGIPIARAFAARIARGTPELPPAELLRIRQALEAAEQRSSESDHRVNELEDRVDFLEKLLQAPKPAPPLPPGGGPPMSV
jgi:hypothetical protein